MKIRSKKRVIGALVLIPVLLAVLGVLLSRQMGKLIRDTAQAVIESTVSRISNESVLSALSSSARYADLVELQTDQNGQVTYLSTDSAKVNALAHDAAICLQEKLDEYASQRIALKLGEVLGIDLLSNTGPNLYVTVRPIGSVSTEYTSEFVQAGINQTRHRVYLFVQTQLRVIMPTGSMTVSVRTQVAVSECIIVGRVPESYVHVADTDQMLNLIP